ncbi:MAG: hypothetical protein ABIP71_09290 [Verrucomicrobiota bacterium]
MNTILSFHDFAEALCEFIHQSAADMLSAKSTELPTECRQHLETPFNELALSLFALQFSEVAPYRRFCDARKISPTNIKQWKEIPSLPASAFKELELSSLKTNERTHVFHSSGTTEQVPSRHFHNAESLVIYEESLLPWFQKHFLSDWDKLAEPALMGPIEKPGFIFLTPPPALAPNSSLVHMFETVRYHLGSRDSFFGGKIDDANSWTLDIEQTLFGLRKSMCANRPIGILGTAFSFVHLLDYFAANNIRYRLAAGSRVLETGGYKGRSRSLPKAELHQLITKHLGIPASHIICEYGMSELSSQAYDHSIEFQPDSENENIKSKTKNSRAFSFPPWTRVQIISPETGNEVNEGETGLIRIVDLVNVFSILAVQTDDLGIRCGNGFKLVGRATLAEPRGCSLMAK